MSRHDERIRLRHMLDHAREARTLGKDKTLSDLQTNRLLELGLVHLMEIVGEAASRISEQTRSRHPSVPWSKVVGMRNRLIHGYDRINYTVLLTTIQNDLPDLIAALERILDAEE